MPKMFEKIPLFFSFSCPGRCRSRNPTKCQGVSSVSWKMRKKKCIFFIMMNRKNNILFLKNIKILFLNNEIWNYFLFSDYFFTCHISSVTILNILIKILRNDFCNCKYIFLIFSTYNNCGCIFIPLNLLFINSHQLSDTNWYLCNKKIFSFFL